MRETLCNFLHIYAKKNVYLYNIMINRKIWGIFEFSLALFAQTSYLFTFRFLAFSSVLMFQAQTETEAKNPLFWCFLPENVRFCRK